MVKRLMISYSDDDRNIALKVRDQLVEAGYEVWIAHEDIRGSVDWAQSILDAIDNSDGLVLIWSEAATKSENVREEIRIARVFLKPVFPFLARPLTKVPSLPNEIKTLQIIQIGDFDANIAELKARLADPRRSNIHYGDLDAQGYIPKAPNLYFFGRSRELKDLFVDSRGYSGVTRKSIPIAITGLAGIGKTQLALTFGYRFNFFFPRGVYWVDTPNGIVHEFGRIGPHLGVKRLRDERPIDYAIRVLEKLRQLREGLIIFDNVTNFSEFRQWCPIGNTSCSVILTTRMSPRSFPVRSIDLTELDPDSAYEMLIARRKDGADISRDKTQRDALQELCRITGNHPLALELCASRLQSEFIKPSDYLKDIQSDPLGRLSDEKKYGSSFDAGSDSLLEVLRHSYASLDEKLVDDYYLLMCCFAPHGINEELIVHAYGMPDEGRRALDQLANISFIRREPSGLLSLHPLVAQFGRDLHKHKGFDYSGKFAEIMVGFLRAHDNNLSSEDVRREKPHIDEALRIAEQGELWEACARLHEYEAVIEAGLQEQIESLDRAYYITEQYLPQQRKRLPGLRLRLGKAHRAAGKISDALDDFNQADVLYREIGDFDSAEAASLRFELGDTCLMLGLYRKAGEILAEALKVASRDLDDSAPEVLQLRQALARHALHLGDFDAAGADLKRIIEDRTTFYTVQPDTASAAGLASAHADLGRLALARAEYTDAIRSTEEALKITKQYHEESDPACSQLYLLLGTIYYQSGDYVQAERELNKASRDFLTNFGERHPNYANALIALGEVHRKQGKFDKAEKDVKDAIAILENVYGMDHPSVAEALEVQGKIYDHLGRLDEEQAVWERIIKIRSKFYPKDHPSLATTHYDYASLFLRRGEYAKAAEHLQLSLQITEQSLGKTHVEYFGRLIRLATCRYEQQEYGLAQEILDEAKGLQKGIFKGSPHPYVARMLQLQSEVLRRQGRFQEALDFIDQAIAMKKAIYGTEDHPSVAGALEVKVDLLLSHLQVKESSEILDTIENIRRKSYGKNHLEYANYQLRRAEWYSMAGRYDLASEILEQSLQTCLSKFSSEHPETLRRQILLARTARLANNLLAADTRIKGVCEVLGTRLETECSLIVAETFQELSNIRRTMGKYDEALTELEKALSMKSEIFGSGSPEVIYLQNEKAKPLILFHRLTAANQIIESALANTKDDQPIYKRLKSNLLEQRCILLVLKKEYEDALQSIEEAIELKRSLLGNENVEIARLYIEKAVVLRHQGKYSDALKNLEAAHNIDNFLHLDENHVYFARILLEQGQTYLGKRSLLAAQEHLKEALNIYDIQPIWNIKQHADAAEALGQVYLESDRPQDALKMFEKAMDIRRALYGISHPEIAETLHNQAKALLKIAEARKNEDLKIDARQKLQEALSMLLQQDDYNAGLKSKIEGILTHL